MDPGLWTLDSLLPFTIYDLSPPIEVAPESD